MSSVGSCCLQRKIRDRAVTVCSMCITRSTAESWTKSSLSRGKSQSPPPIWWFYLEKWTGITLASTVYNNFFIQNMDASKINIVLEIVFELSLLLY